MDASNPSWWRSPSLRRLLASLLGLTLLLASCGDSNYTCQAYCAWPARENYFGPSIAIEAGDEYEGANRCILKGAWQVCPTAGSTPLSCRCQ